MVRPKAVEEIELVPDIVINPDHYQAGFKGVIDEKGRMSQAVGKEYTGCEYYVFIKKSKKTGDTKMTEANDFLTHIIVAETNRKYPELNLTPDDPRVQEHAKILEKIIEDMARWKDKQRD